MNGGYCLVQWKAVCRSKKDGGLGIRDLEVMNIALPNGGGIFCRIRLSTGTTILGICIILEENHFGRGDFFQTSFAMLEGCPGSKRYV